MVHSKGAHFKGTPKGWGFGVALGVPIGYSAQQLKELDGKKLKSTTKEDLDIDDEDEKKKPLRS